MWQTKRALVKPSSQILSWIWCLFCNLTFLTWQVWRDFVREEGLGEPADISPKQYFELWQRKIQSPEVFNALLRLQSDAMLSSDDITSPQRHRSWDSIVFLDVTTVLFHNSDSIVGWGTMLHAGRFWVQVPVRPLNFFNLPDPPSCTRPWGLLSP
jgi:hypothetical protein